MIRLTVLYPAQEGARFDWDYYRDQHMPLVEDKFGQWMTRSEIAKGLSGVPKGEATYVCAAHMYFDSQDDLMAAFRNAGMSIPEDVPNFTDVTPVQQIEEVV